MSDFMAPAVLWAIAVGMVIGSFTTFWTAGAWRRVQRFRRLRGMGAKHVVAAPTTFLVNPLYESSEIEIRLITDNPDVPVVVMAFGIDGADDLSRLIESVADDVDAHGLESPGDPKTGAD